MDSLKLKRVLDTPPMAKLRRPKRLSVVGVTGTGKIELKDFEMATLHDVESIVDEHPDICDAGKPATDELIGKAEAYLNVRFPADYREFLKRWGTLAIGPLEFYGITGPEFESSAVPNAVWLTNIKRKQLALPRELIILYDNNGAEYYCLDTSSATSTVVVWDIHSRQVSSVKAASLFEFIINETSDFVQD